MALSEASCPSFPYIRNATYVPETATAIEISISAHSAGTDKVKEMSAAIGESHSCSQLMWPYSPVKVLYRKFGSPINPPTIDRPASDQSGIVIVAGLS